MSSPESYHYALRALNLPEFGKVRMMDVMPSDVRQWITSMGRYEALRAKAASPQQQSR